jgi:hypothetical protein
VKAPDDLYIIDWDELRLAPPERDLWMLDDLSGCVEAYQKKKTRFEVDRKRCYFFTPPIQVSSAIF